MKGEEALEWGEDGSKQHQPEAETRDLDEGSEKAGVEGLEDVGHGVEYLGYAGRRRSAKRIDRPHESRHSTVVADGAPSKGG